MRLNQRVFDVTEELVEELQGLEPVDQGNWRHGHSEAYVFERDGKHWKVWVNVHHSEGWDLHDTIRATEVREVEKTVRVWEAVPLATEEQKGDHG